MFPRPSYARAGQADPQAGAIPAPNAVAPSSPGTVVNCPAAPARGVSFAALLLSGVITTAAVMWAKSKWDEMRAKKAEKDGPSPGQIDSAQLRRMLLDDAPCSHDPVIELFRERERRRALESVLRGRDPR
jgi:hypothetical protein